MGTIKSDPEAPETRTHIVARNIRYAVSGHPQAGVRRNLLYVVAAVGIIAMSTMEAGPLAGIISLVALMLLATSDQLA
jgi:hypothetical protein